MVTQLDYRQLAAVGGSLEKVQTGSLDFNQYLVLLGLRDGNVVAPKVVVPTSALCTCFSSVEPVCTLR